MAQALVSAELIMALTPVVIKKTPLDPISAIWSRVLSSAVIGYSITDERTLKRSEWGHAATLGLTNMVHIASSYESFRHLPAGQAMSLLYTYPIWNLVFNDLIHDESVSLHEYMLIGMAAIGSFILNSDPGSASPTALGTKANSSWGIFMGLIMALTESGMHVLLRHLKWLDPSKSVWVVNSSAAAWLGIFQTVMGGQEEIGLQSGTWLDAVWLTAFNSMATFSGYWLRYYAIPRISTVTYSMLSYTGLIASYIFGMLFLGERPGLSSMFGAALIVTSGILLQFAV